MNARFPPTGDTPLDRIRREYDLPPATASLLLAFLEHPPGAFIPRHELAKHFGRAHRAECVQPQLDVLRKKVDAWAFRAPRGQQPNGRCVGIDPALHERLRALVS